MEAAKAQNWAVEPQEKKKLISIFKLLIKIHLKYSMNLSRKKYIDVLFVISISTELIFGGITYWLDYAFK
jgi:hypothetical protein